ncbi:DNA-binding transcriptional regulator [Anaerovibrio sp. JC8]|uniref:helix-turn-helix domain-containing protein n=1 Tax=Anaerovibrio sp. JC8 TaxID=1240085 RepID=UPI000A0F939C|nr:helix-turn-helix domain-containing protein [Anaerovibrio sp. JC8]
MISSTLSETLNYARTTETNTFTPNEIKAIRLENNLTPNLLAKVLCVSNKTVEAWEAGQYRPNLSSCRLLKLLSMKAISLAILK